MKGGYSDLHRASIDQQAIELLGGLGGGVGPGEDDRGNATAGTILVVSDNNLLDRTCGLGEVFLCVNRDDQYFA